MNAPRLDEGSERRPAEALLMDLIDGYAESRHARGRHEYNSTTALARNIVQNAIRAALSTGRLGGEWAIFFSDERDFCLAASPIIGAAYVSGTDAVERLNTSAYGIRRFGNVRAAAPAAQSKGDSNV